jgi:tetratricopeptide (TPR) repeat protein
LGRYALLIAASEYGDPALQQLRSPGANVDRLASVLRDPSAGAFDEVTVLHNQPGHVLAEAIEDLTAARGPDDLVLVYWSCHGVLDERQELHFATTNSRLDRLASTAVSSRYLSDRLLDSPASTRVVLLDCCFSGRFADQFKGPGPALAPLRGLDGQRLIVLSSSDRFEYALDGPSIMTESPASSLFTASLIDGIQTGQADRDQDGFISIREMYDYCDLRIRAFTPTQRPTLFASGIDSDLIFCRSPSTTVMGHATQPDRTATPDRPVEIFAPIGRRTSARQRSSLLSDLLMVSRRWHDAVAIEGSSRLGLAAVSGRLVPHELPTDPHGFTGRATELARMDTLLDGARAARTTLLVIAGAAGVGKTALAVHWSHRVAERFPDGQLYVNLRGFEQGPVEPGLAVEGFLRSLGVDPADIPSELDARAALYRSAIAGRRMLVVLDNAGSAGQIRPLLPGSSESFVLITSRSNLSGLIANEGGHRFTLDLLSPDESIHLLREVVGERVDREPQAAAKLARLLAYLPLALRIAGERICIRPYLSLQHLVEELQDARDRLDELMVDSDGIGAIRASLSWSYQGLQPQVARAFRMAGLHVGPELSTPAAAAVMGVDAREAARDLDALYAVHLIEGIDVSRFQLHDLVYRYAAERAIAEESDADVYEAIERMLCWYLHSSDAASTLLSPPRHRITELLSASPTLPMSFDSHDDALRWCETERTNLVAAARLASDRGFDRIAWQLPVVLWDFFQLSKYWSDWMTTARIGVAAARRVGDRHGEGLVLNTLGDAHLDLRQFRDAIDCYELALGLLRAAGDHFAEGWALNNLGRAYLGLGHHSAAIDRFEQALVVRSEMRDQWGEGWTQASLGEAYQEQKRFPEAISSYQKSLANRLEIGDRYGEAFVLNNLGTVYAEIGEFGRAVEYYEQALKTRRRHGDRWGEAVTLTHLGAAQVAIHKYAAAESSCRRALSIYRSLGDSWGEALALRGLGDAMFHTASRDSAKVLWHSAASVLGDRAATAEPEMYQRASARLARVWISGGAPVRAGKPVRISVAYVSTAPVDIAEDPEERTSVQIRILMSGVGADVTPVTCLSELKPDCTSDPATFQVVAHRPGRVELTIAVYSESDGQLLQELSSELVADLDEEVLSGAPH